ncbi:MAG: VanW family protein, partial [Lachnospiraceae bacterium]|nr:VanW family protein [Lachnospiraceae bacterium]
MKKNAWIAGVTAFLASSLIFMTPVSARAEERIPAGVYAAGMSLEGLTEKEAEKAVKDYVNAKLGQTVSFDVNGTLAEVKARDLGMSWENPDAVTEAIEDTRIRGNLIKRYMKQKDLQVNPVQIKVELDVDQEKISEFVGEKCGAAVAEAQDASIVRENGKFVVTPSVTGIAVDMEATKNALNEALNQEETEKVRVAAVITESQPRIRTEDLETIGDVLGTYSTDFSTSGASRSTNLKVGAGKINGKVLMPGDVLSGYECMQPFTTANGYRTATAYENGRSVDSVGGGVCQIATTLYNASLLAELDIVQRQNHSMTVSYVPHSMDAAIAGTYKDIKIRNPYDTPVYVEGYTSGKKLIFTIYGKETRPANRTIKFESETIKQIDPGAPTEQVDPTLQPGERVKVQSAHVGIKSKLYKSVYIDGKLEERTLLNSDSYNASKAIYRVGPAAPAVAEPAPTEPAAPEAPTDSAGSAESAGPGGAESVGPGGTESAGPGGQTSVSGTPAS